MLRIGEFAALSSISISMLRNYDKIGLLIPETVDTESSYRYYSRKQLVDANKIVSLKDMGFGLDEIRLALKMNPDELKTLMQDKLESKQREIELMNRQILRLKQTINYEDNNEEYALSVVKKHFPEMLAVCYRQIIHKFPEEGKLWGILNEECAKYNIKVLHEANGMTIQHEYDRDAGFSDIEVMLEVVKEQPAGELLKFRRIPAKDVASVIFKGSYNRIADINLFIARWLEDNEYEINDDIFYIYHNSPHESSNAEDFVTELCFPIIKKKSIDSNTM